MQVRATVLIGVMLAIVSGITLGATLYREQARGTDHARNSALFRLILDQVQRNYFEELSEADLLDGAFNGVMATLDEHSRLLDADDLSDLAEDSSGRFGGIGVEVGIVRGALRVMRPIPDTPASRAGVRAGDQVVGVDDYRPASGRRADLSGMLERMRGAPGSPLQLHLQRDGEALTVPLTRELIKLRSVRSRVLEPGFAYVRINQFRTDTAADLRAALAALDAAGNLRGLVLDLRNNPGGLLQACVDVADIFLDGGLVVSTRGRASDDGLRYRAQPGDRLEGAPIAVLINRGSASAAEIVAGALRDRRRGRLFGTRTYGKGTVQTVMPVGAQRAIKLTTALYYTPSGQSIEQQGIEPQERVTAPVGRSYEDALLDAALRYLQTQNPSNLATTGG